MPVQADDILVLASDGLSDNLWEEDILDEVIRFRQSFMSTPSGDDGATLSSSLLRRSTLAGMLSEALCSRARCVSEKKGTKNPRAKHLAQAESADEVPFARRAREQGKWFDGGKPDGEFHSRLTPLRLYSLVCRHLRPRRCRVSLRARVIDIPLSMFPIFIQVNGHHQKIAMYLTHHSV